MPALSYKSVTFELEEVKAHGDSWSFSGYASTFNNVDHGGDVVLKGAFNQSIARRVPRLLWQHNMDEPIGKVLSLQEDDRGLHGEFKLSRTTRGHDAYQLLKDGAINSMSIGYIPTDQDFDEPHDVRKLKQVDLLEISLVSLPMNEEARITSVKTRDVSPEIGPIPAQSGPSVASLKLSIQRKRLERLHLLEQA